MFSSPIIIFYSFLIAVVFVIGVAPTALWKHFGGSLSGTAARIRQDRVAAPFRRAIAATNFTANIDYVPVGIGFAFDRARALVFVAGDHLGQPAEALLPITSLLAYATGVITGGFIEENYVDLFLRDSGLPDWRISCAEDVGSANAIGRLLTSLGLPRA